MARVRSTTYPNVVKGPYLWKQVYTESGATTTLITDTFTETGSKSITDTVTADFGPKVRSGQFLPINSCSISEIKTLLKSPNAGSMTTPISGPTLRVISGQHCTVLSPAALPAFVPESTKVDLAVINALASAKAADWDVLTFLGELDDVGRLFSNNVRRISGLGRKIARKAKRRELNRSRRQRRPFSSEKAVRTFNRMWLEARYAWRPLVFDVQSALKALRHKSGNPLSRKTASVVHQIKVDYAGVPFDNVNIRYEGRTERRGSCRYRAVVFYDDQMGALGTNPVITAYELTRFSFLFDWFINVGRWLQAISPREGYTGLGISVSVSTDYRDTYYQKGTNSLSPGRDFNVSMTDLVIERHVRSYERYAYTGVPMPSINVRLNSLKFVDLVALVIENSGTVRKILFK